MEKEQELFHAKAKVSEQDKLIESYREELYSVYTSHSWRYTAPLRKIGSIIRKISRLAFQHCIRRVIKQMYLLLPGRIRRCTVIENMKNRFKTKEPTL